MSEETTEIAVATPETKDAGGLYPGLRMDDVYRFCATVAGSQLVATVNHVHLAGEFGEEGGLLYS